MFPVRLRVHSPYYPENFPLPPIQNIPKNSRRPAWLSLTISLSLVCILFPPSLLLYRLTVIAPESRIYSTFHSDWAGWTEPLAYISAHWPRPGLIRYISSISFLSQTILLFFLAASNNTDSIFFELSPILTAPTPESTLLVWAPKSGH